MSTIIPESQAIKKAIRWISDRLKEEEKTNKGQLIQEAIFRFNLSPKDGDFLINFYRKSETDK